MAWKTITWIMIFLIFLGLLILVGGLIWAFIVQSDNNKLKAGEAKKSYTGSIIMIVIGILFLIGGILGFFFIK